MDSTSYLEGDRQLLDGLTGAIELRVSHIILVGNFYIQQLYNTKDSKRGKTEI